MITASRELIQAGRTAIQRRHEGLSPLLSLGIRPLQTSNDVDELVPSLRAAFRSSGLGQDPVEQELFIAAGLRAAGVDASLVVAREIAPPAQAARYASWVEADSLVLTTGAPVQETHEEILRLPASD